MKKLLLILICLFFSSQSYGWDLIYKNQNGEHYIDKVKRSGDIGYYWGLTNLPDGTSSVVRFEVYCTSEKMRDLKFFQYSDHFGKGTRLHEFGGSPNYRFPEPGTIFELYYKRVCKN